jgi:hypothetical protein
MSSISAISSATTDPVTLKQPAPDGDSAAVEEAESRATKLAERQSGGSAPKATDPVTKNANAAMGKGTHIDTTA